MGDLRYVCLSDLHFGAENSLLTAIEPNTTVVDPLTPSPTLGALVSCLEALVACSPGAGDKPTLVLNGDVLELALTTDERAIQVFSLFLKAVFDRPDPLFDPTVIYVPGNHDHHIWETARERLYARYVMERGGIEPLKPPWHVTRMFPPVDEPLLTSDLLQATAQRLAGLDDDFNLQVVYPNFGVVFPKATVVFHHGHFVESIYRLLSVLRPMLFPSAQPGLDVWDWEADNFAWIDFFWSSLGRSGKAGEDVGRVYDMLQSESAVRWLLGNFVRAALKQAGHPAVGRVVGGAVTTFARVMHPLERLGKGRVLSKNAEQGLAEYLEGPLLRQLEAEDWSGRAVTFVFGHTHKPFECVGPRTGYQQPVRILNTGGWVVDTLKLNPLQGAAIVAVDDEGNAASVRLYNQRANAADYQVAVEAPGPSAWRDQLEASVQDNPGPWAGFSAAAAPQVVERRKALDRIIREARHD